MFDKVNIIDLLYVLTILESNLIDVIKYDEENNIIECESLDISKKR